MTTNASATISRPPAVRVGAAIVLAAAVSVGHCGGFDAAVLAQPGPFPVTVVTADWADAARARSLPVKLYVPGDPARSARPAILFSHGLGGSREGGAAWGRHWASHGFVAIHLQHPGSDEALWNNRGDVPLKDAMRKGATPRTYVDRLGDVQFALDEIARRARTGDPVAVRIDPARIGMSGHSFGARTTLALAGERQPWPAAARGTADARIKAAVAFSPSAAGPAAGWAARFGDIRMPLLSITGTRDGDPLGGAMPPAQRTEPFRNMPPPDKYLLVIDGADHMVFNGGAADRVPARVKDGVERAVRIATLAFWKAYLEDDADARRFLQGSGMRDTLGAAGSWDAK